MVIYIYTIIYMVIYIYTVIYNYYCPLKHKAESPTS